MKKCKFFEVYSGENKGLYVAIKDDISREEQVVVMARKLGCGSIQKHRIGFYNRHSANGYTIWRLNEYGVDKISPQRLDKIVNTLYDVGW